MANPQPTDAHLRVAHSINEAIMLRDFTKRQRKILDLILRLSWGCNEMYAYIPRQRDFSIVGVHEVDIKKELDWLCESHIIFRDGELYAFNKDFDAWQVSRVKPYQPQELSKLLSLNLGKDRPQLSETLRGNLVKHEVSTKQNTKSATPELASPKERLKKVLNKDIYIVPEWIDKELWDAFLEIRGKKKAASTDYALSLIIKDLEKFKASGDDPNEILKKSITNSWKGVFPLRGGQYGADQQGSTKLPPRDGYTKPPRNPKLDNLVEQQRAADASSGRDEPG